MKIKLRSLCKNPWSFRKVTQLKTIISVFFMQSDITVLNWYDLLFVELTYGQAHLLNWLTRSCMLSRSHWRH